MTGVTFCPPRRLTLSFEPHWQFSGLFVHEQALFCMYACASVRSSRGVWIRSGLWLSSAHAGHGALRPCIHSTLFSFPHLRYRCSKNVFSSLRIPAKKKKKKKRQHLLLHTPGLWPFIWYPTFFNYAARPQKNMLHFFPCTNSFWHTGQANKLTVKLY